MKKFLLASILSMVFSCGFSIEYTTSEIAAEYALALVKGVKDVCIEIQLSDELKKETGLNEEKIKNLVTVKFRQSGINISDKAIDTFYVKVRFVKAFSCATYIETQLMSLASLERNNLFALCSAWENSTVISGGLGEDLGDLVYKTIDEFVNKFLALYLESNPREFIVK